MKLLGGATTFDGQLSMGTLFIDTGATFTANSANSVNVLNLHYGALQGTGNLTLTGASTWGRSFYTSYMLGSGQTIVASGGSLTVVNDAGVNLERTLVNNGTFTLGSSSSIGINNGTFQNNGSFLANSGLAQELDSGGGTNTFNNAGTFTKQGAGALLTSGGNGVQFHNTGTVDIQGGILRLNHGGTHSGDFSIASGASLILDGAHSFSATSDITSSGTLSILGGTTTFNGTVTASSLPINSGVTLKGSGTLNVNVTNAGKLAPGNSPGITTINGNYVQTPTGVLEIEVGGLTPGTQHDKVIVSGSAALDGNFVFPLIDGFDPQLNDEITFLTASSITGAPKGVFAPNLGSVDSSLSFVVIKNSQDLRLRFVAPTDVHFVDNTGATQDWNEANNWNTNAVPSTSDKVELTRSDAPVIQRVEVTSADALAHQLSVHDQSSPITIAVKNGMTLATAVGDVTIGSNATIELGTDGNPLDQGVLATSATRSVELENGGMLTGNGTVSAGKLAVTNGTVSPGFSVGHLDIEGDYEQGASGTLEIDITGTGASWSSDTVDVTGEVELGGKLVLDASQLTNVTLGTSIQIVTAGDGLAGGTEFSSIATMGNDDIYFYADYTGSAVNAYAGTVGDFTHDNVVTAADADLFATGLINPNRFFDLVFADAGSAADVGGPNGNPDGKLDFDDIDEFAALMSGSGTSNSMDIIMDAIERQRALVPEPSAVMLTVICGLCCVQRFRRRRRTI
jgi:hypothetical protein